jgi:hypothetical protein
VQIFRKRIVHSLNGLNNQQINTKNMKTRLIMKAVLFVAGIVMITAACKKDVGPTLDFNITVPSDWKYYILSSDDVVYYAQSPQKTTTDSVSEDLVITKNKAANTTLNVYYTAYMTNLVKDTTYHPVSSIDTTIDGVDAIKLTHLQTIYAVNTSNGDTVHLYAKLQKYLMVHNNYGYVVSFNALATTFDEYKKTFDEIIASFSFKN